MRVDSGKVNRKFWHSRHCHISESIVLRISRCRARSQWSNSGPPPTLLLCVVCYQCNYKIGIGSICWFQRIWLCPASVTHINPRKSGDSVCASRGRCWLPRIVFSASVRVPFGTRRCWGTAHCIAGSRIRESGSTERVLTHWPSASSMPRSSPIQRNQRVPREMCHLLIDKSEITFINGCFAMLPASFLSHWSLELNFWLDIL
jgi:hypothetical protein